MADDTIRLEVEAESSGGEEALFRAFAAAFERAMSRASRQVVNELQSTLKRAGSQGARSIDQAFARSRGVRATTGELGRLEAQLKAIKNQGEAVDRTFAGIEPSAFGAVEEGLSSIARLLSEVETEGRNLDNVDLRRLRLGIEAAQTELTSTRTGFQQSALAYRESQQQINRSSNQASRERIADRNLERARFVAITQTQGAREVAEIRATSAQQVALTQAAARRRVAAFEFASRSIRSLERGLRSVFETTGRVAASAFTGLRRTVSNTTTNIRRAFSSSSSSVRNSVVNSNQAISNSYRSSWRSNANSVTNSVRQQGQAVRDFAREATQEVSTIGIGALGGFALLGVGIGRALRGGFERAATLEDSQKALTKLLGTAEKAKVLLDGVLGVVTGTPFKLDQFADAATQLSAFSIEAERIPGILQAIADASAVRGGGAGETVGRLVTVFGQISAAGRVMTQDVLQLTEAGVPALAILGNAFGKTTGEIRDMLEDGAIPARKGIDLLVAGIENGTDGVNGATAAFAGLGQELGQTLRGSLGNASAALDRLGAGIIQRFQPQLVGLVQGATAGLDVLSDAFNSFADAVTTSPVFRVLLDRLTGVSDAIRSARDGLKPIFDVLARGAINFGSALAAFGIVRRLPRLFGLLTFALRRLLSPMNLLLTAGFAVTTFFTELVRSSKPLQIQLQILGQQISSAFEPLGALFKELFPNIASVGDLLRAVLDRLGQVIVSVAVPALRALTGFIHDNLAPAISSIVGFIRRDLIPIFQSEWLSASEKARGGLEAIREFIVRRFPTVGRVLETTITVATTAFRGLRDFVVEDVIPIVGPVLSRAVDIGTSALRGFASFIKGTLIPLIRDDLGPVLAGLGIGLGFLATGNVPLAALSGLAGVAVAAFRNDDLRNAIVDQVRDGVAAARKALGNLVDSGTLRTIGVQVLKIANKIGKTIGNIFTDPKVFGAAAALAGAAAALAGSFVIGLVEGIVSNIPDLTRALTNVLTTALLAAVDAAVSDPRLGLAFAGLIIGGTVLQRLRSSSRLAGRVIGQGLTEGVSSVSSGAAGFGGGAGGFVQGLFGGRAAVNSAIRSEARQISTTLARELARNQGVIRAVTGKTFTLTEPGKGSASNIALIKGTTNEIKRLNTEFGRARVSGLALRDGLRQIGSGDVRSGLRQIGFAVRNAGREIATTAGVAIGAAFAASFISQALFDIQSSGADKIQAGIGTLATTLTAGVLLGGGPIGFGIAALATGVGLLVSKLQASGQAAKVAEQNIKQFADALRDAKTLAETGDVTRKQFFEDLFDQSIDVQEALKDVGFDYDTLIAKFQASGSGAALSTLFEDLGLSTNQVVQDLRAGRIALGDFIAGVQSGVRDINTGEEIAGPFRDIRLALEAAGLSSDDFAAALGFVRTELDTIGSAVGLVEVQRQLLGVEADITGIRAAAKGLVDKVREISASEGVAAQATEAFRSRLDELNNQRLAGLQEQVDAARTKLGEAETAADQARQAVTDFFQGPQATSFSSSIDQATIAVGNAADGINSSLASAGTNLVGAGTALSASVREAVSGARTEAENILSEGVISGDILTKADAELALAPLKLAAGEAGGEAATAINTEIDKLLSGFDAEDLIDLSKAVTGADKIVEDLQGALNEAEFTLDLNSALPAEFIPSIVDEASSAFKEAGEAGVAGFAEGLGLTGEAATQATALAQAAVDAAAETLQTSSPSKVFAGMGADSGLGLAQGMLGAVGLVSSAANALSSSAAEALRSSNLRSAAYSAGVDAGAGLASGLRVGAGAAYSAARTIAAGVAAVMRAALEISSPSKVTAKIGVQTVQGYVVGINQAARASFTAVRGWVSGVKRTIDKSFTEVGRSIGKAISQGIADSGSEVLGSIGSIIDQVNLDRLSRRDILTRAGAEISSTLFSRSAPARFKGGVSALDVNFARLQVSEIFRDLRSSNEALIEQRRELQQRLNDAALAQRILAGGRNLEDGKPLTADEVKRLREQIAGGRLNASESALLRGGTRDLGFGTLTGQTNRRAFLEAGNGIRDFAQVLLEAGTPLKTVNQEVKRLRAGLVLQGKTLGFSTKQMQNLVRILGLADDQLANFTKEVKAATKQAGKKSKPTPDDTTGTTEPPPAPVSSPPPIIENFYWQGPVTDPEAAALAVANKVAVTIY